MSVRDIIQQYGGIAEALVHAFLSFAPVAANPEDTEAESAIQLMQSVSDAVSLRRDRFAEPGASKQDGLRFALRILRAFQLWGEMRSSTPYRFALRLEIIKLSLSAAIIGDIDGGRLPDTEMYDIDLNQQCEYVGSRSGTKLRGMSKLLGFNRPEGTQLSDFLHALAPLVYLTASPREGWTKSTWTSYVLSVCLEYASIMALPEGRHSEKRIRTKKLVVDCFLRQPMFNLILNKPASTVSRAWGMIPLLRDLNYLEYYLHMHKKYFYFHQ
jgi:hypothetical protein